MTETKVYCGYRAGRNPGGCGRELHWERQGGSWEADGRDDPLVAIRCIDCGMVMCRHCARHHFGESDEKDRAIAALKLEGRILAWKVFESRAEPRDSVPMLSMCGGEKP